MHCSQTAFFLKIILPLCPTKLGRDQACIKLEDYAVTFYEELNLSILWFI